MELGIRILIVSGIPYSKTQDSGFLTPFPYMEVSCMVIETARNWYLTIIPQARMDSESIAPEAEGRMGYWLRGHSGSRNNCFSKIQLFGQKYRDKTTLASKTRFSSYCFGFQSRRISLLVGYNI